MAVYYFAFFFVIFIMGGLNLQAYYSKEKLSLWVLIIFSFLGFCFGLLAKQDVELLQKFDKRKEAFFVVTGKNITRGYRGNSFNGYYGVFTNNQIAYLPYHIFDDYRKANISIGDTVKVWNLDNSVDLIFQSSNTQDNSFIKSSNFENVFLFLICNTLWFWYFKKSVK